MLQDETSSSYNSLSGGTVDGPIRRRPGAATSVMNKEDKNSSSRPVSVATDEPLLDPQLAAMLEARKVKSGESTGVYDTRYLII